MFERFSQASRRVVVLAQQEARRLEHDYIGTEHELLGLLLAGDPAVEAAIGTALPVDRAREAIVEIIGRGTEAPRGHISFTPRAKKVLELALREALRLRSRTIRPGHILLALIREGDGVGAQVLAQAGVDFETARLRAIAALDATAEREPSGPTMASAPDTVIAQLRTMCADDAEAALDRAVEAGVDGIPTPWSLLRGIAAGEGAAASLLEGLDLTAVMPLPPEEPVGRPFLVVFQRSQGLAGALGTAEPGPGPGSSLISSLHLLAVLLSPGEGSVTGELAALGADPAALRRQVLALL